MEIHKQVLQVIEQCGLNVDSSNAACNFLHLSIPLHKQKQRTRGRHYF